VEASAWNYSLCEPLAGDASLRKYYRLRKDGQSAVLMDASRALSCFGPFIQIDEHLAQLGFSVPGILARDEAHGLLLLEDFGDANFAHLLEDKSKTESLWNLAIDVLVALHRHPKAIPSGLRAYHSQQMLADIELFLEWRTPGISEHGKTEFREAWRKVLPLAHQGQNSLLLRDYHVANLMLLPGRKGIREAGLIDFQDAYQGPATYDLVSLLEDARRDIPQDLKDRMLARYIAQANPPDLKAVTTSMAILAAQRHTRVLAIFERLSRQESKHDYKNLHSPRVEKMLHNALTHPLLSTVQQWFQQYARQN
jgi:N-acetylmuramate 1-kinase